ncbi:hypothetical protein D3C78_912260 [compost metagenome]
MLGQVQLVMGVEVNHTLFKHQRHRIADIRPECLHLAVGDFQGAFRRERDHTETTAPVDTAATGANRDQGHVRAVVG